jgi:DNA-binding transcriptional ArsR family regulator
MITIVSANDVDTDVLLAALADPTRRRIVELLAQSPMTASEIHAAFPIANPAVSRHLRVLREAGLIKPDAVRGDNRIRLYKLQLEQLERVSAWIAAQSGAWQQQLESFKEYVAARSHGSGATK